MTTKTASRTATPTSPSTRTRGRTPSPSTSPATPTAPSSPVTWYGVGRHLPGPALPVAPDPSRSRPLPTRTVLWTGTTGEIRVEDGADGVYLQFDLDCLEALPFCRARCCALPGTELSADESATGRYAQEADGLLYVLARRATGQCVYLDPGSRRCTIYGERPDVCQAFHCTRGAGVRGWRLLLKRHEDAD